MEKSWEHGDKLGICRQAGNIKTSWEYGDKLGIQRQAGNMEKNWEYRDWRENTGKKMF